MGCPIRPSNVRVYQFHHDGTGGEFYGLAGGRVGAVATGVGFAAAVGVVAAVGTGAPVVGCVAAAAAGAG